MRRLWCGVCNTCISNKTSTWLCPCRQAQQSASLERVVLGGWRHPRGRRTAGRAALPARLRLPRDPLARRRRAVAGPADGGVCMRHWAESKQAVRKPAGRRGRERRRRQRHVPAARGSPVAGLPALVAAHGGAAGRPGGRLGPRSCLHPSVRRLLGWENRDRMDGRWRVRCAAPIAAWQRKCLSCMGRRGAVLLADALASRQPQFSAGFPCSSPPTAEQLACRVLPPVLVPRPSPAVWRRP